MMHVTLISLLAVTEDFKLTDWIVALFTAVLALVAYLQYKLMHRQDEHFQYSERAWIVVSPAEPAPVPGFIPGPSDTLDGPGRDKSNIFICSIKNTGRTPARLIESSLRYLKVASLKDIPETPDYGKTLSFHDLLLVVDDSTGDAVNLYPEVVLNKPEIEAVKTRKAFLYAFGKVIYKDVYGGFHETRFGYVYHMAVGGGDPRVAGFRRDGLPPMYNGAT